MVAYDNVKLNQRVEVRIRNGIISGTVKYKGPINGVAGDWVGVQLDKPVGQHDGMVNGRRYFACLAGHGIFTLAHNIRFCRTRRSLFNKYRTVKVDDEFEENLFDTDLPEPKNGPRDPIAVDRPYSSLARAGSLEDYDYDAYAPAKSYILRQSISSIRPPVTSLKRPSTSHGRLFSGTSTPLYYQYERDFDDEFVTKPTIPHTHMPREALQQQVKRGWDSPHVHLVRDWSDHVGRSSLRQSFWNDY